MRHGCAPATGRELARGEDLRAKSHQENPGTEDAYLDTLAVIQHRQGDREGAIETGKRCLRVNPYDSHHLFQLGRWLREATN